MNAKTLPRNLTSYDFLKTLALTLMIVDHVGYFFFPGELWWRVAGRLCVPVWFFLIGYARSRDLSPGLWIGAALVFASNFPAGMSVLPVNILITIIMTRLLIDPVMNAALRSRSGFWAICTLLLLLVFPSSIAVEYGTQGLILAMFGYLIRHRTDIREPEKLIPLFFLFALASFAFFQWLMFRFSEFQFIALAGGLLAVMGLLYFFRPVEFPRGTARLSRPLTALLQLTGRHTLPIYVAHLLLFKALALWLSPERFIPFNWHWVALV